MRRICIDASSTSLGWVLSEDGKLRWGGSHQLKGDIEKRVDGAYAFVVGLVEAWQPQEVVVEAPVPGPGHTATVQQARVSGGIILACEHKGVAWVEGPKPNQGKKALTGKGTATKEEMLRAAAPHLGLNPNFLTYKSQKGTWVALLDGEVVLTEHQADAVGVALALIAL
jgi:Holliday junction resolvasome RuvABC endonuclease subunit